MPPALERWLLDRVAWLTGDSDFWWPAPDLVDESGVRFKLTRPRDGAVFFESRTEQTYWNCKWMKTASFLSWGVTNWTWDTDVQRSDRTRQHAPGGWAAERLERLRVA
jgi:hypothetical protein